MKGMSRGCSRTTVGTRSREGKRTTAVSPQSIRRRVGESLSFSNMASPSLAPEACLVSGSTTLAFQSSSQCVCVAGQRLKFAACHAPLEPDETRWVQSSGSNGMSVVATCARAKLFAYTEKSLESKINVCSYPDFMPVTTLEWSSRLGFTALAFSRDGAKLAALTDLPSRRSWYLISSTAPCWRVVHCSCRARRSPSTRAAMVPSSPCPPSGCSCGS